MTKEADLESHSCKAGPTEDRRPPPGAWPRLSRQPPAGTRPVATLICERTSLCCFQPSGSWLSVTVATGNKRGRPSWAVRAGTKGSHGHLYGGGDGRRVDHRAGEGGNREKQHQRENATLLALGTETGHKPRVSGPPCRPCRREGNGLSLECPGARGPVGTSTLLSDADLRLWPPEL